MYALKLLLNDCYFCFFVSDTTSSHGPLNGTTIGLIVGIAVLAVVVAFLVITIKFRKRVGNVSSKAVVMGSATNEAVFVDDEDDGEKKNGVVM